MNTLEKILLLRKKTEDVYIAEMELVRAFQKCDFIFDFYNKDLFTHSLDQLYITLAKELITKPISELLSK